MTSPLLAGIPISSRFAEKLGIVSNETITPEPIVQEEDKFQVVDNQIKDLETRVNQQLEELKQGWNRLPGAAGKRDDDIKEPFIKRIMKENPDIFKTNPDNLSEMQKFENTLRHKYKLDEKEIENLMIPMWSTILRNENPTDKLENKTYQNRKKTTEADPLLTAVEKLAGMIEGMNKPKTVIRDKDGRITGVA